MQKVSFDWQQALLLTKDRLQVYNLGQSLHKLINRLQILELLWLILGELTKPVATFSCLA